MMPHLQSINHVIFIAIKNFSVDLIPLEQYSVRIKTVGRGKSMQAPTNRTVFSWLTSRACLISHSNVDVISTFYVNEK